MTLQRWSYLFLFLFAIDAIWLVFELSSIGGSALHGYNVDGHYFVSTKNTPPVEVSESVWLFNRVHSISVMVLFILCAITTYISSNRK